MQTCYIYILSDSLGDTAEHVAKAAAGQFNGIDFILKKHPYIDDVDSILEIIENASKHKSMVVFTTVMADIRKKIIDECQAKGIRYFDVMYPMFDAIKEIYGAVPVGEPGTIHKMDESYFSWVKAIEFAVKYDDGKDPKGVMLADVVLLGISRTSKTPLSMYLAHKNVKVANIPLVPEVPIPDEVFKIDPKRIIGLINTPQKLLKIRGERLKAMGLTSNSMYANVDRINEELEFAGKLFDKLGCPVIDVSNKAVEETANMILQMLYEQKMQKEIHI